MNAGVKPEACVTQHQDRLEMIYNLDMKRV